MVGAKRSLMAEAMFQDIFARNSFQIHSAIHLERVGVAIKWWYVFSKKLPFLEFSCTYNFSVYRNSVA